jgi:hypothetical protein
MELKVITGLVLPLPRLAALGTSHDALGELL